MASMQNDWSQGFFSAQSVLLFYLAMYVPLEVGSYAYPTWANAVGWLMCMSSFVCVPIYIMYSVIMQRGSLKEVFTAKETTQ